MRTIFTSLSIVTLLILTSAVESPAQKRRGSSVSRTKASGVSARGPREVGSTAVVIDETLSVLRAKPSLFGEAIQRMRRGRAVKILSVTDADGVRFYRVAAPPANTGWVQADAVFGKFRPGDEERLARLVQASDGFDQVEIASEFLNLYPRSPLRPSILLLFGDLLEETALRLTRDSSSRLSRREMAATGAPVHSYFLNFVSLDRYRKLGITFLFNPATRAYHYDGASWNEIVTKYPNAQEAIEAQKRLGALREKMSMSSAAK
jgi:hypothetical protein